ncbi:MAG TPA: hypothetical protein VH598_03740 [Verrucomicrobiae bacterium]|nr:hypothetical protein [Verrucomicrobiae bacterium]
MQIPKSYSVLCAAVLAASPLCAQNANSDADAKAREALRKKISELEGKPAAPPPAAAPPVVVVTPAPTPAPAPVVVAPAPAPTAAPAVAQTPPSASPYTPVVTPGLDSDAEAKAREALRQKISERQGQATAAANPAPAATPPQYINTPQVTPAPVVAPAATPPPAAVAVAAPVATPVATQSIPVAGAPDTEA